MDIRASPRCDYHFIESDLRALYTNLVTTWALWAKGCTYYTLSSLSSRFSRTWGEKIEFVRMFYYVRAHVHTYTHLQYHNAHSSVCYRQVLQWSIISGEEKYSKGLRSNAAGYTCESSAIDYGSARVQWINNDTPLNFNFVSRSMFTGYLPISVSRIRTWCLHVTNVLSVMHK